MNGGRSAIALALILLLCFAGVWDVYCAYRGRPEGAVSTVIYQWAQLHPILPFAIGVLIGHLLWPVGIRQP